MTKRRSLKSAAGSGLRSGLEPGLWLPMATGAAGTIVVALVAWLLRNNGSAAIRYLDSIVNHRGPVQYVELFMAFALLGTAIGKISLLKKQWEDFLDIPLSGVDLRIDKAVQDARDQLAKNPRFKDSLLFSRLDRALGLWLGAKKLDRMGAWLKAESDRETAVSDASFAFSRYFIWAIPIMGFIGTVQGLGAAVSGFSVLGGAADLLGIKSAIVQVTRGLGVAFDTTLLALMLSIPLMLLLTWVQKNEETLLIEVDHYLDENLLAKLPSTEAQPIVVENMEDALEAAFRRYIPDPDRYEEVFTRSIERAGVSVETRFANLARDYAATLRDLTTQLGQHLSAVTETTAGAVGGMLNEVRQVSRDETDRFHQMLAQVEQRSADALARYQKSAESLNAISTGATTELAAKLGEVARLATGIQELLRVEQTVQKTLQSVNQTQDLQQTFAELRRQLDATTTLCRQLGQPRRFTLQEGPNGGD